MKVFYKKQATTEDVDYITDFTEFLQSSQTVSSATATHTPPSGSADSVSPSISSPYVTSRLGTLSVTGIHYLDVLATMSNSEKAAVRYVIQVDF